MNQSKNILAGFDNGIIIEHTWMEEKRGQNIVHMSLKFKRHQHICTVCHSENAWTDNCGKDRNVFHLPQSRRPCIVHFHQNRYRCLDCHNTYFEQFDWLCNGTRMTRELFDCIRNDLAHPSTKKEIARINGVTEYFVDKVLESIVIPAPRHLPDIVCLDETKADARLYDPRTEKTLFAKFVTNFSDGTDGRVLDLLPYKTKSMLIRYFMDHYSNPERSKVRFLCCDMGKQYLNLAKDCFPNAIVCVDNYHIIARLNQAVDDTRRKLQNCLPETACKDLKNLQKRLLTAPSNQNDYWGKKTESISARLLDAFDRYPDLREAYAMLQYFHDITRNTYDLSVRCQDLDLWISTFENSLVDDVRSAVSTISGHLPFIHNAWKYKLSNATCEGNNNALKALKKISYGIHDFDYLRTRILLICGRPGVSRSKKKKVKPFQKNKESFFYRNFPALEDYSSTVTLEYLNSKGAQKYE